MSPQSVRPVLSLLYQVCPGVSLYFYINYLYVDCLNKINSFHGLDN